MKIIINVRDKDRKRALNNALNIGSLLHKKYKGFKKGRTTFKDGKIMIVLEK
jgi:hypothetical protein